MSTTIDQRVVQMKFDNSQFERNVSTSVSTLDKLKQALNLTGSAKGLEQISASAKKVDLNPISNGITQVHNNFSALEIAGITVLTNIVNKAVEAGEALVKSLTIDPISTGFSEYEEKINSIQTILMGAHNADGTAVTLDQVNDKIQELNLYADKTIYSFADMTKNIGKFTNAGVDLDMAVAAIQGVSNEAAVSGANAEQASHAMYNFAQALSAGYVKLIDWKSIENANMATQEFKQQLIETALEVGTLADVGDGYYQTLTTNANGATSDAFNATAKFNDQLSYQWMTTEVLTKTLAKYANEETDIGKKAFQAATEVKTFTQLLNTLKEAAQSGWSEAWGYIIGDYDQAKKFMTSISDVVGGFIGDMDNARNNIIYNIFQGSNGVGKITKQYWEMLDDAGYATEEFAQLLVDTAQDAGVDVKTIFDNADGDFVDSLNQGWLTTSILDQALTKIGKNTKQYSKSLQKVYKDSKKAGTSINNLIKDISGKTGHELFTETIVNSLNGVLTIVAKVKMAFYDMFGAQIAKGAYNLLEAMSSLTNKFVEMVSEGEGFTHLFEGIFSLFSIIPNAISKVYSVLKDNFSPILKSTNLNLDSVAGTIGEMLIQFSNAVKQSTLLTDGLQRIINVAQIVISTVKDIITNFLGLNDAEDDVISGIAGIDEKYSGFLGDAIDLLKAFASSVEDILISIYEDHDKYLSGAAEFFRTAYESIQGAFTDLDNFKFSNLIDQLKEFGGSIRDGLNALLDGKFDKFKNKLFEFLELSEQKFDTANPSITAFKNNIIKFSNAISNTFNSVDWGAVLTFAGGVVGLYGFRKALIAFNSTINSLTGPIRAFSGVLTAVSKEIKAEIVVKMATAVAIIVGSIIALAVAIDQLKNVNSINSAVGIVVGIIAGVIALMLMLKKVEGTVVDTVKIDIALAGVAALMLSLGITLALIIYASKSGNIKEAAKYLIIAIAACIGVVIALKKIDYQGGLTAAGSLVAFGGMLVLVATSLWILSKVDFESIKENISTIINLFAMIGILAVIAIKMQPGIAGLGVSILAISVAMLLLTRVAKIIAGMSKEELNAGVAAIAILIILFGAMVSLSRIAKPLGEGETSSITSASKAMLSISAALLLVAISVKIMGNMPTDQWAKGVAAMAAAMVAMILAINAIGKNGIDEKSAATIKQLAVMVAVLTACIVVLSNLKFETAMKGVTELSLILIALGACLKLANNFNVNMAPLLVMTGLIALLSAVLLALAQMGPEKVLPSAIGLSAVLIALGVSIKLINGFKVDIKSSIAIAIEMGVLIIAIAAVLAALDKNIKDGNKTLTCAAALSLILVALGAAIKGVAALGQLNIKQIGVGILGMDALIADLIVVFALLGQIADTGLGKSAIKGAEWLGKILGALVSGITDEIFGGLSNAAEHLNTFMDNFKPFLDKVQEIKDVDISGLDTIVTAMGKMSWAGFKEAILGFFSDDGKSMVRMANNLKDVVAPIKEAAEGLQGASYTPLVQACDSLRNVSESFTKIGYVDENDHRLYNLVDAFYEAIDKFKYVANTMDGLSTDGLDAVGDVIPKLAEGVSYLSSLGSGDYSSLTDFLDVMDENKFAFVRIANTFKGLDPSGIDIAVGIITKFTDAMKGINLTEGSLKGDIFGDNSLSDFAWEIELAAEPLVKACQTFASEDLTEDGVDKFCSIISTLASAIKEINNTEGSLKGDILGDNSVSKFANDLDSASSALARVSEKFASDQFNKDGIDIAIDCISQLAAIKISKTGGIFSKEMDLETFGYQLESVGASISVFNSDVPPVALNKLPTLGSAIVDIAKAVNTVGDANTDKIKLLAGAINTLARSDIAGSSEIIQSASSTISSAASSFKSAMSATSKNLNQMVSTSMKNSALKGVDAVKSTAGNYTSAGTAIAEALIKGLDGKGRPKILSCIRKICSDMVKVAKSYTGSFRTIGQQIDYGLANGIRDGQSAVVNAAAQVMADAVYAAKQKVEVESPSKVFKRIGLFMDEGLAIGINKGTTGVIKSTKDMASASVNAMSNSIAAISETISNGVDSAPTIRPVLDLSQVNSGVSTINGMFGATTLGVSSSLSYINGAMSTRQTAATNNDVISAINRLNATMKDNGSTTVTNINGITYDDGSNVANAIKTLVNAVTVEGRI